VNEAIAAAAEQWEGDEAGFAEAVQGWFRDGAAAGFFRRVES
jgi:hypothetical protein